MTFVFQTEPNVRFLSHYLKLVYLVASVPQAFPFEALLEPILQLLPKLKSELPAHCVEGLVSILTLLLQTPEA